MHEIDYGRLYDTIDHDAWILELVRQLDERFVKREELPPLVFEAPEPQTRISDTADYPTSSPCQTAPEQLICDGCKQALLASEIKYDRHGGWWHWHCLMNKKTHDAENEEEP